MLFPTVEFALFFAVAFAGAWALARSNGAHKTFLLGVSWIFYGLGDWRFLPLLVGVSLEAALVARALQHTLVVWRRKALLFFGVAAVLVTLFIFKYLGFFGSLLSLRISEMALPVGISFFCFHAISLMVDAWRGQLSVPVRIVDACLYVAFFPQLVAGPILRASSFLPVLAMPRSAAALDVGMSLKRVAQGLLKKVVLAQWLATALVDPVFEAPWAHGRGEVWLAVYGYAAQIFLDFSGYSDMAIGFAGLLGYALPENFDRPYLAANPQEFWRRWHISLSTWFRDYVYVPLGGSRGSIVKTAATLGFTMVLGGLWHGAGWTFIAWGAFHAVGLVAHRFWSEWIPVQRLRATPAWSWVATALTFHFVCLGWVLFRAPTLGSSMEVMRAMLSPGSGSSSPWLLLLVACGLLVSALRLSRQRWSIPWPVQGVALGLFVVVLDVLSPKGITPFIYFQF